MHTRVHSDLLFSAQHLLKIHSISKRFMWKCFLFHLSVVIRRKKNQEKSRQTFSDILTFLEQFKVTFYILDATETELNVYNYTVCKCDSSDVAAVQVHAVKLES